MTPEERDRLATVESEIKAIQDNLGTMQADIKTLVGWANRWKGGFAVLLGVGALIGWFADKIFAFLMGKTPHG